MYLTHLLAGLATPPPLRVDSSTWTEADWEVQQHLDEQDTEAFAGGSDVPPCGFSVCPDGDGGGDLPGGGDR